jgi:hypothetical protein
MKHAIHFFIMTAAALCACGGGKSGGDVGDSCTVPEDCRDGLDCVGNVCTDPGVCSADQTPCGSVCCDPGEDCVAGACLPACPSGVRCGAEQGCCDVGETCVGGVCCPMSRACGDVCCNPDEQCSAGECIACLTPLCNGQCCGEGELCHAGQCCSVDSICGVECCGPDEVCEFESCHRDCGDLVRCGETEECCSADQVCYLGECITPGDPCDDPYDCPPDQYCDLETGRCMPRGETEECEYHPPTGEFTPHLGWQWTASTTLPEWNQVMMTPMVANLSDDNGDGLVDEEDIPDIVFITFRGGSYNSDCVLRAISGDGSGELFTVADAAYRVKGGASVAIADLDDDGLPEILTCKDVTGQNYGPLIVFNHDGTFKWETTDPRVTCASTAPSVGDVDHDGSPEILIRYTLLDNEGTVLWHGPSGSDLWNADCFTTMADIDDEPGLEIIGGNIAIDGDGTILWQDASLGDGYPAVADLDSDGDPEVVVVSSLIAPGGDWNTRGHWIYARELDGFGTLLWGPFDINQGVDTPSGAGGGGPPTIADFDGDTLPEIAAAGGYGYVVFEAESGDPKWFMETTDLSSRVTGSSVFDFEGDGAAEVVYNDEHNLRIYRGIDGTVLMEECNTSGTLWEYPVIVDVDNDEHAEIVVANNNYAYGLCDDGSPSHSGIKVFEDALDNWVKTRRIWNQHTYHVTNIEEDGSVPVTETENWTADGLNNFRQNVQPEGLFNAPDLVPGDLMAARSLCPSGIRLTARIVNQGTASAPPGIPVSFYEGDPLGESSLIETVVTSRRLYPGESEVLSVDFPLPAGHEFDLYTFFVIVDSDEAGTGIVHECREENNTSEPFDGFCENIG